MTFVVIGRPAMAADLVPRHYIKAPAITTASYDWSGFYMGANAGYGTSHQCWDTDAFGPFTSEGCHNATGGVIGGQIGYRRQLSHWVFGVEAQGDWASLGGSNLSTAFGTPFYGSAVNRSQINGFGLFTGQVGYAWNSALLYLKGGAAVISEHYKLDTTVIPTGPFLPTSSSFGEMQWGTTVGIGLEYGFAHNWSVGIEYNHIFLNDHDLFYLAVSPGVTYVYQERFHQNADLITARINYHFDPVATKY